MKNTILKSLVLSLFITNIWSVTMFFTYYFESPGWFVGLTTFFIFLYSCWTVSGIGVLAILISLVKFWKSNSQKVFLLSTVAFLNTFLSILIILTTCFEILEFKLDLFGMILLISFIIPIVSFFLIKRKIKESENGKISNYNSRL
ncbi:hypothetical protein HNP37_001035 [Flavobacterium nitrogenifigens]|uniref:Uncharacterized protein n=2 Tax=Flavobacterium TaxID=237 RepID=A0A7W7IUV4_9FLAO|nr:hypothetical protein [Flavobacterium nitrogenifigens]MBB6385256.1 hypothetical protein [Flavobacterium notoginsengisoli]